MKKIFLAIAEILRAVIDPCGAANPRRRRNKDERNKNMESMVSRICKKYESSHSL